MEKHKFISLNYIIGLIGVLLLLNACDKQDKESELNQDIEIENNKEGLPAIAITGNYISPNNETTILEARDLIINKKKSEGYKGDLSENVITEVTTNETWKNIGIQLFRFKINYWVELAIVKNNELLTSLICEPAEIFFLADLDKDNIYEVYTNFFFGSGIVSKEILGYNVVTNETYHASFRNSFKDLNLIIRNGILMVEIYPFRNKEGTLITKVVKLKKDVDKNKLVIN